jgi:vacuolar-type H+-ATPase subunit H
MSNKIIDEILQAEKQSEQIVAQSKQEAIKSLTKAEEKAVKIKFEADQKYKEDMKLYQQNCEIENKQKYQATMDEYKKSAQDLTKNAEKNLNKAVEIIVKKII